MPITNMTTTTKKQKTQHSNTNGLISQLANPTNHNVRNKAFNILVQWLTNNNHQQQQQLTLIDTCKLWRGLYYMMWHADGFKLQRELAYTLSDIQNKFNTDDTSYQRYLLYLTGNITILSTEWLLMDRLRMDKFMYYWRCNIKQTFNVCLNKYIDNIDKINDIMNIYRNYLLTVDYIKASRGLQLYTADVWLIELNNCINENKLTSISVEHIMSLITPLLDMCMVNSQDSIVIKRVVKELIDPLLRENSDNTNETVYNIIHPHMLLIADYLQQHSLAKRIHAIAENIRNTLYQQQLLHELDNDNNTTQVQNTIAAAQHDTVEDNDDNDNIQQHADNSDDNDIVDSKSVKTEKKKSIVKRNSSVKLQQNTKRKSMKQ